MAETPFGFDERRSLGIKVGIALIEVHPGGLRPIPDTSLCWNLLLTLRRRSVQPRRTGTTRTHGQFVGPLDQSAGNARVDIHKL